MVTIDIERHDDWTAREALLDRAMGRARFLKPSQRLRDGRLPADGLSLVARSGDAIVGSVRLWEVLAGVFPALLLGPLAVDPDCQGEGIGGLLMREAINRAAASGHGAVLLVGDAPYYARFGFNAALARRLTMPAPVDPNRFLGLELRGGALAGAAGAILPAGVPVPAVPQLPAEIRLAA